MSAALQVPADATGRIDVFAVDLPAEETGRFMARKDSDEPGAAWPLRAALGADFLDPGGVELVRVDDLAGVGLAGYLTEGLGADEAGVAAVRPKLDALRGHVLIIRGPAWGGLAQLLHPRPPLDHVATLYEVEAEPPGPPLTAETADPTDATAATRADGPPADAGGGSPGPVIVGGLIAAAVLVAVLGLVLGR